MDARRAVRHVVPSRSCAVRVRADGMPAALPVATMPTATLGANDRRLLDKLVREIARAETQATEHAPREAKRLGNVPPVLALVEVGEHSTAMRARFVEMLTAHELRLGRAGIGATLATLRHLVVDRVVDAEHSYRTALLDLRHGIELVKLLRDIARREMLFGVIRWCDDWLAARRTLVARVEAQLFWFMEQIALRSPSEEELLGGVELIDEASPFSPRLEPLSSSEDLDWHADRTT